MPPPPANQPNFSLTLSLTYLYQAVRILGKRWPEVTLIVGTYCLAITAPFLCGGFKTCSPFFMLTTGLLALALTIIFILLQLGFLRTACVADVIPHTPMQLLGTGAYFFWRCFGVGLLMTLAVLALGTAVFAAVKGAWGLDGGLLQNIDEHPILFKICGAVSSVFIMKFLLLPPAKIIVLDCTISQSLKNLRNYSLRHAPGLVLVFALSIALSFAHHFVSSTLEKTALRQYVAGVCFAAAGALVSLIIGLAAVRFVAAEHTSFDVDTDL